MSKKTNHGKDSSFTPSRRAHRRCHDVLTPSPLVKAVGPDAIKKSANLPPDMGSAASVRAAEEANRLGLLWDRAESATATALDVLQDPAAPVEDRAVAAKVAIASGVLSVVYGGRPDPVELEIEALERSSRLAHLRKLAAIGCSEEEWHLMTQAAPASRPRGRPRKVGTKG